MNRHILNILMAVLAVVSLISCNERIIEPSGYGYLGVSLQKDDEVILKSLQTPSDDMVFAIEVYKGEELVATCPDHRTLASEPLKLAVDTYRVVATSGNTSTEAEFGSPVYSGETEVTIAPEKLNEAEIIASLANVMVTVEFDESIVERFTSYSVTVTNSTGIAMIFSSENGTIGQTGYLKADGTLAWTLILVNPDGSRYANEGVYTGVEARQHYVLKFSLAEDSDGTGKNAIKLVVDSSMEEKVYELVLDFDNSSMPQIGTNDGFEQTQHMYFTAGDQDTKVFNFAAEKGIKSLTIESSDEVMSKAAGYNYELVGADASTISLLAEKGIRTSSIVYGAQSASVDVTDFVAGLPIGDYSLVFSLYDIKGHMSTADFTFTIMSDVDADILSATPWAKFVIVEGKWFTQDVPAGLTFNYRKASDTEWTAVPEDKLEFNVAAKTYSAVVTTLEPETTYYVKAVSAEDQDTRYIEFTTEKAGTISNMSFDDWWLDSKVWYPYAEGADDSDKVWDSANKAAASFIGSSTVPDESNVISGKAAKMESKYAVIAFAAGNIYTGHFNEISGMGGDLDWGVPFASRPVALKGYYSYSPVAINRTKSPYDSMKGQMDKCQIQVLLTDWDAPFNINTSDKKFVDFDNDEHIIAYAKFESEESTDGYREFTLPLVYRNHRTPKYIVITCCASYLGDYFTGGEGSTLYVDEFSFEYDIANLTPEQAAQVNYR